MLLGTTGWGYTLFTTTLTLGGVVPFLQVKKQKYRDVEKAFWNQAPGAHAGDPSYCQLRQIVCKDPTPTPPSPK